MKTHESSDALLARGAALAGRVADVLCGTPNGRDHCGALHGVWVDLRRVGLAAEPARHATFYADALGTLAERGATRVLVAGCADWGMLETVAAAYRGRPARLDATVVDRCPTPVLLSAWFAAEIGIPIRTAVGDVVEWGDDEAFDVICTHSLLTYPTAAARQRLVANWHRVVRPGGAVVTVSRLSNDAAADVDDARARAFADVVAERYTRAYGDHGDDLHARAERFAKAQVSHPVGTAADLRSLFETHGFDVVRLDVRHLEGTLSAGAVGGATGRVSGATGRVSGAARTGEYGEIVVVRR